MDKGTNRDVDKLQRVAGLDISAHAACDGVADAQAVGGDDVALFAALILNERDMRRTVGIVFKGQHGCGNAPQVALEIDDTIFSAICTAAMADGDSAGVVTTGIRLNDGQQALFRSHLGKARIIGDGHLTASRGRRLVIFDCHLMFHSS